MTHRLAIGLIVGFLALPAFALDISEYQIIDLSHSFNSDTLYWPTSPTRFEKEELSFGETVNGMFYSAYTICTPEHGGTHLDAPQHFAADGLPTDRIPLRSLMGSAVVIDIGNKADTASTDFGKSENFVVHRIAAARDVSNLENLTNLDRLPATGAVVFALPMKIESGSGGPVRVVALIPKR